MKMLIKPNESKKIFELLKEGYDINMAIIKDTKQKDNYVIFYYKLDEYGNKIHEEKKE